MSDTEASPEPALPHAVALSWGVAERPQRGPKRELSIERIVDAAIEIADAEGLGAVSMAKVASALGFTTMSLYRYVTSKDDLLLLMQDAIAGIELPEPPDDDWRAGLKQWTLGNVEALKRHPWYSQLPITSVPMTPNTMRLIDTALRALRPAPLTDNEKMACVLLVASYARAVGGVQGSIAESGASPEEVSGSAYASVLASLITADRFPDLAPVVTSGAYTSDDYDDFAFGLERMLDGIQRYIDEGGSSAAPTSSDDTEARDSALYSSDKRVKEAAKARREAEKALRDARKRERDALKTARERAENAKAKAAR
ncbi:TetR/AcrR family transcriptional regulator C-terminal domain-containing protein [Humibacter ginsenosidimutans]|uniref:TetR family transcriptional regulator n=1 Tax=Humibacter ginsenosidimutans TaxID=2599293 RepID=A0A5B8M8P1_9MICO|nr:TetR/AcrR family transcriptional regulator C-terminal domain-containing protein [Humibacter ginsenosidimutans]QDZ16541.1 TetR family transcriptional regulator [Humibacter ginsenosidimutans]